MTIPTHHIDPDDYRDRRIDDQLVSAASSTESEAYTGGQDLARTVIGTHGYSPEWLEAETRRADAIVDDPATSPAFRSTMAGYSSTLARHILENS